MKRIIFLAAFATFSLCQTGISAQCPASKEKGIHVVQPKETLYAVSRKYKVSVAQLCEWNGISQNDILPMCAKLRVASTAPKQAPIVTTPAPSAGNFVIPANTSHMVKEGETMASIAAQYGFTEARLRAMNRMGASDKPYPGEALAVSLCPEMEGPLASYSQETGVISTGGNYERVIHIVSHGETITGIAAIYGMTPKEVADMNNLALGTYLQNGQRLTIEDRRPKSTPATPASETKPAARTETPVTYSTTTTNAEPPAKSAPPADTEPKAHFLSDEENDMIREINLVRANPAAYVQYVEEYLRNSNFGQRTETAARELMDELKRTSALPKLEPLECLFTAAKKHGEENRKKGENEHQGSDGSWPWDRVRRECSSLTDGNENLVGGPAAVRDAVILLLIDENISNRGHRRTLLDSKWRYVACYKIGTVGKMANSWVQLFGY